MQQTHRKLQRSVTEIRRSRSGRPSASVTVITIILPRSRHRRTGDGLAHVVNRAEQKPRAAAATRRQLACRTRRVPRERGRRAGGAWARRTRSGGGGGGGRRGAGP